MSYTFKNISQCNMCGTPASEAIVLGIRGNFSQGFRPVKKLGVATTVVKCRKCELIFANPQPIPSSIDQHYGVPPEEYWSEDEFKIWDRYFKHEIEVFSKLHTASKEQVRALDVGAGLGKSMKVMKDAGFDAYGIEPSKPFFDRALSMMNISPNRLQNASVETAQFENNFFDFITFGAVLEHLYDPSECLEIALKWLKPNGFLHIQVPSSAWLTNKIVNFAYRLQGLNYVANISPMHNPYHLYEFNLNSFVENGKKLNYEVAYHTYMVSDSYLPKILDPLVKPIMKATNTGMLIEVYLKKH
jgi:2-polyprenyl-3-methyl-5-hydroxy-6-metoxy-1,4-benzoquinol methylase